VRFFLFRGASVPSLFTAVDPARMRLRESHPLSLPAAGLSAVESEVGLPARPGSSPLAVHHRRRWGRVQL
jgi:hypothetical protein